jgi:MFS family permease
MSTAGARSYEFAPDERPLFPGGTFTPRHARWRKVAFSVVALVAGITGTFGNGLVSGNVPNIAGGLNLYATEAAWFPAIYVAFYASANLLIVKARAQFGIQATMQPLLILYALSALIQLLHPDFWTALITRAVSGITAGGLVAVVIFNLLQIFPAKIRPLALAIGVNIGQLGPVLARLISVETLSQNGWHALALTEMALALATLVLFNLFPLPPSERHKAFEKLDFVTIALALPAFILFAGVLGVGRQHWWFDTPWLGWMLVGAIPLAAAAITIERSRKNPLLQMDWIGSRALLRFAAIAFVVRVALAEQTYGAVGLLTQSGLTNDQLRTLFAWVAVAMVAGTATMVLSLRPDKPERLRYNVFAAALIIALGAWLDTSSNNLTRPAQLIWSQALIGFGTCMFIGSALLFGFVKVLERGPAYLVSFLVLFSSSQNFGGLAGSALLGTYQTIQQRAHAAALSEQLVSSNPLVAERLQSGFIPLNQAVNREAAVLAFNDTFWLVTAIALATAAFVFALIIIYRPRKAEQ